jgi:hypothetical protein
MITAQQQDISLLNINLSNARSENESYEDYRNRLKTNKSILKTYFTFGRDAFREMFPNGVADAMKEAQAGQANEVPFEAPTKVAGPTFGGSLHLNE